MAMTERLEYQKPKRGRWNDSILTPSMPPCTASWWIGLDRAQFQAGIKDRIAAMQRSKEASMVSGTASISTAATSITTQEPI